METASVRADRLDKELKVLKAAIRQYELERRNLGGPLYPVGTLEKETQDSIFAMLEPTRGLEHDLLFGI